MPNPTRIDVLPIQEAVATASPSAWRDGLVVSREPGTITVAHLDGGASTLTTRAAPDPGEPVAVHPVAELVAIGGVWYAARPVR
ncbi:nuclease [Actinotalea solisilvae]|uniref:nuclease n=1 Tax=Actinotalea solisilvae TaxID=2072922 RepID=UPI0018F15C0C|nr:nuclease [Actinotalea solisilvae]